jgi:NitT/TauT family transport system permease protein
MTESDEIRRAPQRRGTPSTEKHDARGHQGGRITGAVSRPWLLPALFGVLALAAWEAAVRLRGVPDYVLPGPLAIVAAFLADPTGLLASLASTLLVTFVALLTAAVLGGLMAMAMAASRFARAAIQPWAVVLQVTPLPAIAPLIIIWVGDPFVSLVVCATVVAFFPVFANTLAGLGSPPADLADLFRLYGAGRVRTLLLLRLPAALPYFLTGLRISGGLALVGAVVAEFVAGSGGFASGLAYRILEAGYRLQMPRMFAALVLLALAGIAINAGLDAVGRRLLCRRGDAA